jgi:hypothetical protein
MIKGNGVQKSLFYLETAKQNNVNQRLFNVVYLKIGPVKSVAPNSIPTQKPATINNANASYKIHSLTIMGSECYV